MNRRGFIGTITALAGLALAKIKAPAAPQDYLTYTATATFKPCPPGTQLTYTQTSAGKYRWLPVSCPKDIGRDKPCGTEPMPGYDILCMNAGDCPMMDTYRISIDNP